MDNTKKQKIRKTINFIEELSWLLDSRKALNLKEIPDLLNSLINEPIAIHGIAKQYTSPNPNIHFLIGVLPRLFQDKHLFPSNLAIAQFADEVLNIPVTRFEKRSKYELIGLIVCETDSLSDKELSDLVQALSEITGNEEKLKKIREAKKDIDFSWNETIQKLTK